MAKHAKTKQFSMPEDSKPKRPTKRVVNSEARRALQHQKASEDDIARVQKRQDMGISGVFLFAVVFFACLVGGIVSGVSVIGDIGIVLVFIGWFPSLIISAQATKWLETHSAWDCN